MDTEPINSKMEEQIVAYSHIAIFCIYEDEKSTTSYNTQYTYTIQLYTTIMDESHKHNIEGKKLDMKGFTLYNAPNIKFKAW